MKTKAKALLLATLVVVLVITIALYETCKLNAHLPASIAKKNCPSSSGFVGALGRTPEMQHCIAYSGPFRRAPYFNRCTWC